MESILLLGINNLAKSLSKLLMVECDELIIVDDNQDRINGLTDDLSKSFSKCKVVYLKYNLFIKKELNDLIEFIKNKNLIKVVNNLSYSMSLQKQLTRVEDEVTEDLVSLIYLNIEVNRKILRILLDHNNGEILNIGYLSNNVNDIMFAKILIAVSKNLMNECNDSNTKLCLYFTERNSDYSDIVSKINNFNPKRGKEIYIPIKYLNKF